MKQVTKIFLWLFIIALINGIIGYLVRILYARNLTLAEYGLFYAVMSFVFFFSPFRDLGMQESATFYMNKYIANNEKGKIKGMIMLNLIPQIILSVIFLGIFFVIKPYLVQYYFKDPLSDVLFTLIVLLFTLDPLFYGIANIYYSYQRQIIFNAINMFKMFAILIISLVLFSIYDLKSTVPGYAYLYSGLIMTIIAIILVTIHFWDIFREKIIITKEMVKDMFSYAIPIAFSTAGAVILTYSDIIILTYMKGTESVGLYNIAFPAISIIFIFVNPMISFIFPKISKLYHAKNNNKITEFMQFTYDYMLIFTIPLGLMFFAYPELIIKTLFGEQYLAASNTLRAFAFAFVFMVIRTINFHVIAGIGKAKERSVILYIGAGLNVILDILFIPKYGPAGAAVATGIGYALMAYLTTRLIVKEYPVKLHIWHHFKTIFCGMIFLGTIYLSKWLIHMNNAIFEAIIVVIISTIVYFGSLYVLEILNKKRIDELKKTFL